MISERYKAELLKLKKIAEEQGNKINSSIIFTELKCEFDEQQDVLSYFEDLGIEILHIDVEPGDLIDDQGEHTAIIDADIEPFDPTEIDIKMNQMTIDLIVKRIRHGEFDFKATFQREAGLWSKVQKSQLIESILLRIPLPAFYFDASDSENWLIIDGLQRLSAVKEYVVDETLKLTGLEFLRELDGKKFSHLPRQLQRRIEETNINAYLISPLTPKNVKFNIFKRLNTGGLVLTSQEMRNALYQGTATEFISELSRMKSFIKATDGSIKSERMLDREFCLRFVAFTELSLDKYVGKNIEEFLNKAMEHLNNLSDDELREIKERFDRTMNDCEALFGRYAFRKMFKDGKRRPINKALFDAWSYAISQLKSNEVEMLITDKGVLIEQVVELFQNSFVEEGTESSTTSLRFGQALSSANKEYVLYRFEVIQSVVDDVLETIDIDF